MPDYASKADKEDVMDYDTFKSFMDRYIAEQGSEPVDDWAVEAWEAAKKAGVLDGTRPHDPLTRQEAAVILERLGLLEWAVILERLGLLDWAVILERLGLLD